MTEDERITCEMMAVLDKVEPELRFSVARTLFQRFVYRDGLGVIQNPEYSPTPSMAERERSKQEDRVRHERALELARASAPVIHIHNETRRGWFG